MLWRYALPPFVTKFVPNSRFSYQRLTETGVPPGRIALIRNAVSRRPQAASVDDDLVCLAASRRTILIVGQIAPFKGTHLAVDAVLELIHEGMDAQAIVLGDLPAWPPELVDYTERIRARVSACGADDRVHFVGVRENVLDIMKASYLLAAPILQEETFGNVALEARDVGLPVVTFARGGLPELVEHRHTGYVCETTISTASEGLRLFPAASSRARIRKHEQPRRWPPLRATIALLLNSSGAGGRCSRRAIGQAHDTEGPRGRGVRKSTRNTARITGGISVAACLSHNAFTAERYRVVAGRADLSDGRRVLDYGCGDGALLGVVHRRHAGIALDLHAVRPERTGCPSCARDACAASSSRDDLTRRLRRSRTVLRCRALH